MKTAEAGTLLLLLLFSTSTSNFSAIANYTVGVKKGDWIKYDVTSRTTQTYASATNWKRMEVMDVSGTNLSIRLTEQMSDEEESNIYLTGDVATRSIDVWVIPANLTYGAKFNALGFGTIIIDRESAKTYAGASRTVLHACALRLEVSYSMYWDKQTGVAVEIYSTMVTSLFSEYLNYKATETNIWQAESDPTILYVSAAAVTVIAVGAIVLVMRRKRLPVTQPPQKVQHPPQRCRQERCLQIPFGREPYLENLNRRDANLHLLLRSE